MSAHKFENLKSVLIVLSSKAMAYDIPALRKIVTYSYPDTAVFFISTSGDPLGSVAPQHVDLAIDFTPPDARQSWLFAFKLKARSKYSVGRNVGWFYRKAKFTRVYDEFLEKASGTLPKDYLASEAWAQRKVIELCGIKIMKQAGVGPDRGKDIASEYNQI